MTNPGGKPLGHKPHKGGGAANTEDLERKPKVKRINEKKVSLNSLFINVV
jgi:hypothetical protein